MKTENIMLEILHKLDISIGVPFDIINRKNGDDPFCPYHFQSDADGNIYLCDSHGGVSYYILWEILNGISTIRPKTK